MSLEQEIDRLLGITPVPALSDAFGDLKFIVTTMKGAQANKHQLLTLAKALGQLLETLDQEFKSYKLRKASCVEPLKHLKSFLGDVSSFVHVEGSHGFLKAVLHAESSVASIEIFYHRIRETAKAFEISALLRITDLLHENEAAQSRDVDAFNSRFRELLNDNSELRQTLKITSTNVLAMMVSIDQRMSEKRKGGRRDQEFYDHAFRYLKSENRQQYKLEGWMISPFDVDCGKLLGKGGFGLVFEGTWNRTPVAIKKMHIAADVHASNELLAEEITIWKTLRHPNVLQFFGANTLDDDPFLVMPLMQSTARKLIHENREYDPVHILRDVSLGLEYLHSRKICHGDLKGVNILVDAAERALLCDFGLTEIKKDMNTRTIPGTRIFGSTPWMAPELFLQKSPGSRSDIYAFAITLYELYTDHTPTPVKNWANVVERPEPDQSPRMTDGLWRVAARCWAEKPEDRPTASWVQARIQVLISEYSSKSSIGDKSGQAEDLVRMAKEKEELARKKEELAREQVELARAKERVAREKEQWESEMEEHAQAEARRREVAEGEATERAEKVAQELAEAKAEAQLARAQAEQAREEVRHLQRQQDRTAGETTTVLSSIENAPAVADDRIQNAIEGTMAKLGMQPCPSGFPFNKTKEGYVCQGGSHLVTFEQLGMTQASPAVATVAYAPAVANDRIENTGETTTVLSSTENAPAVANDRMGNTRSTSSTYSTTTYTTSR